MGIVSRITEKPTAPKPCRGLYLSFSLVFPPTRPLPHDHLSRPLLSCRLLAGHPAFAILGARGLAGQRMAGGGRSCIQSRQVTVPGSAVGGLADARNWKGRRTGMCLQINKIQNRPWHLALAVLGRLPAGSLQRAEGQLRYPPEL